MAVSAPMDVRARDQLDLCIGHGTTQMRSHVMVDGSVGLKSLETILRVREEYKGLIDIQLVAFPQSGILMSPGTPELLDEAIGRGCRSRRRARSRELRSRHREAARRRVRCRRQARRRRRHPSARHGHAGRVRNRADRSAHARARHGGTRCGQPRLRARRHLHGSAQEDRRHPRPLGRRDHDQCARRRPFPPILALRNAGVTVFSGNDNIRDSWWPYGDGDMLRRATTLGYRSGFNIDEELRVAFDVVTVSGAKALRLEGYGCASAPRPIS